MTKNFSLVNKLTVPNIKVNIESTVETVTTPIIAKNRQHKIFNDPNAYYETKVVTQNTEVGKKD